MERGISFIVIGICFIACLVGLIVFIFWFSGTNDFGSLPSTYKAYSQNAIDGIKINSDIKYKGINVGRVKDINFKDDNFNEITFEVTIRSDLPIKKDSILKVEQSGLIGSKYLELIQNDKSNEFIKSNGVLKIEMSSISEIMQSVPNLANNIDNLLSNANNLLSKENTDNIAKIIISIQDSVNGINKLINSMEQNTDEIESLIQNVNKISINANNIASIVNNKIQDGEYDLKTTLTPALSSIEQSMNNLNTFVKEGSILINDLKENPYNTIFGYRNEDNNVK